MCNEIINSCSGPTQVMQIFNLNSNYFRDYFNMKVDPSEAGLTQKIKHFNQPIIKKDCLKLSYN